MRTNNPAVLLTRQEHDHILYHLRRSNLQSEADKQSAGQLRQELKKARLLEEDQLPPGTVRLGSRVTVRELETGLLMELYIVIPALANWKEKKISVLSPLGTALIGYRRGVTVKWKVPAGERLFRIEEVED